MSETKPNAKAISKVIAWIRACLLGRLRPKGPSGEIKALTIPGEGENDLGREYETNSERAHISAYILIAGLVLELINSVVWFHGAETIAGMAAVLLIVGGVWGEVFFANKARIAGDKELEKYRMRAAEASHKAAEANLELAKFRSARSISNAQADEIAARLKEFSASYDVAVSTNDSEIMAFLYLLHGMLGKAGWIALPWNAPTPKIRPIIGPEIASGFPILNVIISAGSEGLRLASRKLAEELKAVGIEASAHGVAVMGNAMSKNNAIHIWIGRKA